MYIIDYCAEIWGIGLTKPLRKRFSAIIISMIKIERIDYIWKPSER